MLFGKLFKAMQIPLTLSLMLLTQTVSALDIEAFNTLDENSPATARAFLALPLAERQKISLELLNREEDKAPDTAWQIFLAADLAKHRPKEKEKIVEARLSEWHNDYFEDLAEKAPDETIAAGQLCILQLQQAADDDLGDIREEVAGNLEVYCTKQLSITLGQTANFTWFANLLNNEDAPEYPLALQNIAIPDSLTPAQSRTIADALLPALQAADSSEMGDLGYLLDHMENETTANALLTGISLPLLTEGASQEKAANAFKKLLWLNTADSARLFWDNAMHKDKLLLSVARQALTEYIGQSDNDSIPDQFHRVALQHIEEKQDIRLAATYMSLATTLEDAWDHGLNTIDSIEEVADKIPSDPESQALLKYVYLQGAGSRYQSAPNDLEPVARALDKAAAIPGEPLSWYLHKTGETEEKRADQHASFKPIQRLHASGELATLIAVIDDGKEPEQAFRDLPLPLYGALLDNTLTARLSHDPETGAALLLSKNGDLIYFNGKQQANKEAPFTIKTIGTEGFEGKPTLTSPLALWFSYWFNALAGEDDATALSYQINAFAAADKLVDQRLLFEVLEDGEAQSYPDYQEYVRYGQEILLNLDVDGEIQQSLLVFPAPQAAERWLSALVRQAPLDTRAHPLWHHAGEESVSPLWRVYTSPDYDKDDITLSPVAADKAFVVDSDAEADCEAMLDIAKLDSHAADFQKAEYALYRQGYQLSKLHHDDRCE